jgi:hypothetical protein
VKIIVLGAEWSPRPGMDAMKKRKCMWPQVKGQLFL